MLRQYGHFFGLPAAFLLLMQVIYFVATADRGLDFSDESFYLLNYQFGRDLTASATMFGVFLELPFRLLGGDVASMRIFGLLLLLACGALLAYRTIVFADQGDSGSYWPFVVAGMAGTLLYFVHVTTLRTPSYNLIVLACFMVGTALILMLTDGRTNEKSLASVAVAYGVVIGICGFTKAPSALALAICHLMFLLGVAPLARIPGWMAFASAGAAFVALAMIAVYPGWPAALLNGIATTAALEAGHGALPVPTVRAAMLLALGAIAGVAVTWSQRWRLYRWFLQGSIVGFVAVAMVPFSVAARAGDWWPLMGAVTVLAWWVAGFSDQSGKPHYSEARARRRLFGLVMMLLVLPLCYSIGTNTGIATHSRMAGGIALMALLLALQRMHARGILCHRVLALTLAIPCIPLLVVQWRAHFDGAETYRLNAGLALQTHSTVLGSERRTVRLDSATHSAVYALADRMAAAGYVAGEPILDVTGEGPGLVYALGGRPLGTAWLLGGYAGSQRAAAQVLSYVPIEDLRRAWVISSDGNDRSLRDWAELLIKTSGGTVALEQVAQIEGLPRAHPGEEQPAPSRLTLWRPRQPQM